MRVLRHALLLVLASFAMTGAASAYGDSVVRVLAAGSLKAAFDEIGDAFAAGNGIRIENGYGPSGVLRERIEKGEKADLFASADMGNPLALASAGRAGPVILFARNRLCALVRPGLAVTPGNLLDTMLDPGVTLGTSTPKADPAGGYTWAMFAKADTIHPGSSAILEAKALRLMGHPDMAKPPTGRDLFGWHLSEHHADLFIAFCSASPGFMKDLPAGTVIEFPPALATGADYGLTLLAKHSEATSQLALFILSQAGQTILARNGFDAPLLLKGPR